MSRVCALEQLKCIKSRTVYKRHLTFHRVWGHTCHMYSHNFWSTLFVNIILFLNYPGSSLANHQTFKITLVFRHIILQRQSKP